MPSFQVPVLGFADGFLSPFPDSLPQLFLRCLPCAFAFGLSPSDPLSFVRFSSGSGYSAFCFFLFISSRPCLTAAFPVRPVAFASVAVPVIPGPVSRALFPGSCTRLSVSFLSPFPDSLPQLFLRCFPFAFAFGLFPSKSLPFVRFSSGSGYSAFCSSFPLFPSSPHSGYFGAPSPFSLPWLSPFFPT